MHPLFVANRAQLPQGRPGSPSPARDFAQQRSDLTDQLTSLTVQRDLLTQQLRNADEAGQRQLQAQIKLVGDRTNRVMSQLTALDDASSKALAATPGAVEAPPAPVRVQGSGGTAVTIVPPQIITRGPFTERVAIFGILGITVLLVSAMQFFRRSRPAHAISPADAGRLERLQQAVDVIAIEVERISEAQRYMSKALSAGPAEEIKVAARERAKAP